MALIRFSLFSVVVWFEKETIYKMKGILYNLKKDIRKFFSGMRVVSTAKVL